MGLTTEKYNDIMREYERKRIDAKNDLDERAESLYIKYPRIKAINDEISSYSIKSAKALILEDKGSIEDIKHELAQLILTKEHMLTEAGYDKDYLSLHYDCKSCKDTGFIDGKKCHCLQNKIIDALYNQSNIKEYLKKENFKQFNLDLYDSNYIDPVLNISARENMSEVYKIAKEFTSSFDTDFSNLFIYGETGVGKTFLTNCIAKELIDTSHSVIYMSSINLFDLLAKNTFNKNEDGSVSMQTEDLLNCDLLVIDDLGTEMINSFTASAFFNLINERFLRRKSVIISSNLSIVQIREMYSERVFSRIASNYTLLKIFGKDLRLAF